MVLKIYKENNSNCIKIKEGETLKEFKNLDLINALYNDEKVDFEYDNLIDENEKEEINNFYTQIKEEVKSVKSEINANIQ